MAVKLFNDFINYRNNHFIPHREDVEIQTMIDKAEEKLQSSKAKLNEIVEPSERIISLSAQLSKSISEINSRIKQEKDWLKKYFSKGKLTRKLMFSFSS